MREKYDKLCRFLSINKIAVFMGIIFLVSLLPVCYLSFVNRASGDDLGYGTYTRIAWMSTHSLLAMAKAIGRTIRQFYYGWQGTWFSIFLFTLQPEVFSDRAYVIVAFIMIFLWTGSTILLFREVLVRKCGFDKGSFWLVTVLFLLISIQYIPSTKSSIFWFNGCAHYLIPFAMCQLLFYFLLRYGESFKTKYFMGILVVMTLLGGANYQAALFALVISIYCGIVFWITVRNKKVFLLIVPVVTEMIGLMISMKAPGNKVRGGEDFGFSVGRAINTILVSFRQGATDIGSYAENKPLVIAGLATLALILLEGAVKRKAGTEQNERDRDKKRKKWFAAGIIAGVWCLYCAMQAPTVYAGVEFSSGVYNMNYQCFLLMSVAVLLVLTEFLADYLVYSRNLSSGFLHRTLVIPGFMVCLFIGVLCRGNIKDSTSWKCMEYITSGQAADYKWQMDLQTSLLETDEKDVVLPFINDDQGPLMQMPVTDDPESYTSSTTARFYQKNSVIAMPRTEWEERYGKE